MLQSKEWYEVLEFFERAYKGGRNDKEPKELWPKRQVFQHGERNKEFFLFLDGYMLGKSINQN